jgi:hypothetical protein
MSAESERSPDAGASHASEHAVERVFTISWILLCSSDEQASVHQEIDRIFSVGFSFYPELEWKARYPPPQGHDILGAWRDSLNRAFAFLLSNPGMKPLPGTVPLLLHCAGTQSILASYLPQIHQLKDDLLVKNGRRKTGKVLQGRLKELDSSKSIKRLMGFMGPITAVINALALYLRRLPAPVIEAEWLSKFYNLLLPSVYIGALLLLLLFILLCLLYIAKVGYLQLKGL